MLTVSYLTAHTSLFQKFWSLFTYVGSDLWKLYYVKLEQVFMPGCDMFPIKWKQEIGQSVSFSPSFEYVKSRN